MGIDNRDLMPKILPDSEVEMIGFSPAWIKDLIMAQFRIETATPEGTFAAATKVLDHYQEMGVNCLWINPIYQRDEGDRILSGNNGYGSFGPEIIDNQLSGTDDSAEAFCRVREFVKEAHARHIRVLFDVVVWGVAKNAPIVRQCPEFFLKDDGEYTQVWGGYGYRYDSPAWREWYINACVNFILKTGADGFRIDLEPFVTGYDIFKEIRRRLYAVGRKVLLLAEGTNRRLETYDLEQVGVGYYYEEEMKLARNYFMDHPLVDHVRSGIGIGDAELMREGTPGRFQFYTINLCDHDTPDSLVQGDRLRFGYQGVFSPFIPLWYIGEEWHNPLQLDYSCGPIFYNRIDWSKMDVPENRKFYETVKQYIRIRRSYPDIFTYFSQDHRDSNICVVPVEGEPLQAYARFANDHAIMVLPNSSEADAANLKATIPYAEMGLSDTDTYVFRDLMTEEVIATGTPHNIEVTVAPRDMCLVLVEKA